MRKVKSTMFQNLESVTVVLRALSNSSRLRIALALLHTELSVATLEESLEIKQPNLSQQLAELRKAGILEARRSAKSVFYSIADSRVRDLIALIAANIDGVTVSPVASQTAAGQITGAVTALIPLDIADTVSAKRDTKTVSIVDASTRLASEVKTWQGEEAQFAKVWTTTNR
jgi:DNA-binding transcriptional ArsR family regulator